MGNYYTSDQHFDHEGVLGMNNRPFKTVEEMNDALVTATNAKVGRSDSLYILGDFAWKRPQFHRRRITCKNIVFIIGNHDKHLASKNTFGTCHDIKVAKFSTGDKVILCHYPMAYWPSSHRDAYHLYGHMHTQREETLDTLFPDRRSMDIGVPNAFALL